MTSKQRNKRIASVLRSVRKLLSRKGAWIKGYVARTKGGRITDPGSKDAAKFCLVGGIEHVLLKRHMKLNLRQDLFGDVIVHLNAKLKENLSISIFNDLPEVQHKDVLAFLDDRIAAFSQ